jgi:predicted GNAT family acetyltransferase
MNAAHRALKLRRTADVDEFDRLAGEFLRAREAEHNLMLALCSGLRATTTTAPLTRTSAAPPTLPPYFAVVTSGDSVVATAMRTPPHNAILSAISDERALDLIVDDLLAIAPDLTGVLGEKRRALRFAERWTTATMRSHHLKTAERIFQLSSVIPPQRVGGRMRTATPDDVDLVVAWFAAFIREALREDGSAAATVADLWLNAPGRTLYLWEDGPVVSMCGAAGRTPSGTRIGAVYTPPERRGRGYASNCVASASQAQLNAGLRYCFLYTDLANPTSNHIYRQIGYEPVCDVDEYRFDVSA